MDEQYTVYLHIELPYRNKNERQLHPRMDLTEIIWVKEFRQIKRTYLGFPGGAVVENLPANEGDTGSSPALGRSHMPWSN